MSYLFNRSAELIIANKANLSVSTLIRNLRIEFSIEKTSGTNPNKSTISIYNVNEKTRNLLTSNIKEKDYPIVMLNVGYGEELANIFTGTLDVAYTKISYEKSEAELHYKIECSDGGSELGVTYEKAFDKNSKISQIIDDISKKIGVIKTIMPDKVKTLFDKSLSNGFSFAGTTKKVISNLSESVGVEWSIQDRTLIFVEKNKGIDTGYFISPRTGLIGIPAKGEENTVILETLLLPKLKPFDIIELQSDKIRGYFRIEKVTHHGDTHGRNWNSKIEAKSV